MLAYAFYFLIYIGILRNSKKSIQFKLKETSSNELSDDEMMALKSEHQILKEESKPGVHAESQILSYILMNRKNISDNEIYLGVSLLCCLSCRVLLMNANQSFKNHLISIDLNFRGQHDLHFGDNWIWPDGLVNLKDSIATEIYEATLKDVDKLKN